MTRLLTPVLLLVGIAICVLGLDAALGGMRTLGWFIDPDFVTVTNPDGFLLQDSHARFLGAMWFATGLVFVVEAVWRAVSGRSVLRSTVIVLCLMIALSGVFRLAAPMPIDIMGSFLLEIIGFPLLAYWLYISKS